MPAVTVLFWNIQVLGDKKLHSPNSALLQTLIQGVAAHAGADIVCICEVMSSQVDTFNARMTKRSTLWDRGIPWDSTPQNIISRPNGNREAYSIFWKKPQERAERKFEYIHNNLAENQFPNNFSRKNGRRAAWVLFQTEQGTYFNVTIYHAPPRGNQAAWGINALEDMDEINQAPVNGNPIPVGHHFLTGDYNLDMNKHNNYDDLERKFGVVPALEAGGGQPNYTMLKSIGDPLNNPQTTLDYRKEVTLDNILFTKDNQYDSGSGEVIDVLDLIGNWRHANGGLTFITQGFQSIGYANGAYVNPAMRSPQDAWLLYRYAVSDHLPVVVTANVP